MMQTLFVATQQSSTREWVPVARLDRDADGFRLVYTRGAMRAEGFRPFGRMDDLHGVYRSTDLFPLFANRVLTRSRPEFSNYFRWTGLPTDFKDDPLQILAITGGLRGTDPIEVFPLPERTSDGRLRIDFFVRGMQYFASPNVEAANLLQAGTRLYMMHDLQNEYDRYALCLRTGDPAYLLGYLPKYYTHDVCRLLEADAGDVRVTVKQVNSGAPLSMRVLCSLDAPWPEDFEPFSDNADLTPIASVS
ncbi:hypothetical protein DF053_08840 [Burkholderia cepacia]|nr:hypothetical protein DF053_08840 [Burkholderia cepacia]